MKDYCIDNLKYEDFLEQNNINSRNDFFNFVRMGKYIGTDYSQNIGRNSKYLDLLKQTMYDDVLHRYRKSKIMYSGDEAYDDFFYDYFMIVEKNINSWIMQAKYIYDLLLNLEAKTLTLDESRNSTYDMDIKSKYKEAQTPTLVLENTDDFLDKYTNLKNNLEKSDDRTTTSEVHKGYLQELENVNKLYVSLTSQIIASFSPLFVQVIY